MCGNSMPSPNHARWFSLRKYIPSTPAMALLAFDEQETSEAVVGRKSYLLLVVSLKTDPLKRNGKASDGISYADPFASHRGSR